MAEIVNEVIACLTGALQSKITYPLPKNILPQDVKERESKYNKEIELPRKNEGDRRLITDRQTTCEWE